MLKYEGFSEDLFFKGNFYDGGGGGRKVFIYWLAGRFGRCLWNTFISLHFFLLLIICIHTFSWIIISLLTIQFVITVNILTLIFTNPHCLDPWVNQLLRMLEFWLSLGECVQTVSRLTWSPPHPPLDNERSVPLMVTMITECTSATLLVMADIFIFKVVLPKSDKSN